MKKSYESHEIEITFIHEQSGRWSASVNITPPRQGIATYTKYGFASAAEGEQALWEWATATIDGKSKQEGQV
jgi:hypothetical protein